MSEISYVGQDHEIYVSEADGTGLRHLSRSTGGVGGPGWQFRWPTYSPNGRRLAFAGYHRNEASVDRAAIVLADPESGHAAALYESGEAVPIYLYWAPDNRRITVLMQRDQALELMLLDTQAGRPPVSLAAGQAAYWSWAPDGRMLALHIGGDQRDESPAWTGLLEFEQSGIQERRFSQPPGAFRAPAWSPNGQHLALAYANGDSTRLMIRSHTGQEIELSRNGSTVAFSWAPGSDWLAFSSAYPGAAQVYQGVEIARPDGVERRRLGEEPLMAFWWSPDGQRLASIHADVEARSLVWGITALDGALTRTLGSCVPSDDFAFQMSFFDQFAQSAAIWSPDGRHIVYAAEGGQEHGNGSSVGPRIMLLGADGSTPPVRLASGHAAVWSP